jgi:hypothetical protein
LKPPPTAASEKLSREIWEKWSSFHQDVSRFYNGRKLQFAFRRCDGVPVDLDPSIGAQYSHFATLENIQVGSEISMSGRFFSNVVSRVISVIQALWSEEYGTLEELADMPQLPRDFRSSCAKTVPQSQRAPHNEPDVVFKIPGTGDSQRVRAIGELKFYGTYSIQSHWHSFSSTKKDSVRHLFGKYY